MKAIRLLIPLREKRIQKRNCRFKRFSQFKNLSAEHYSQTEVRYMMVIFLSITTHLLTPIAHTSLVLTVIYSMVTRILNKPEYYYFCSLSYRIIFYWQRKLSFMNYKLIVIVLI